MTQRIFDIENEKDMADLWDILPDNIVKIKQRFQDGSEIVYYTTNGSCVFDRMRIININWQDKTEITRPINYENMIGCVVYFYNEPGYKSLGILKKEIDGRTFIDELGGYWDYIEPAKKSELKFWGE